MLPRHFSKFTKTPSMGFTLIELLIVIVILAILTTIGLSSFASSQIKSRDSRRKSDLQNITRALETYYNDKGEYPIYTGSDGIAGQAWGNPFVDPDHEDETLYMNVLPSDPSDFAYYYTSGDGSYFQLYAYLENENDQALTKDGDDNVMVYSGTNCGAIGTCNYGIASTNYDPATGHTLVTE